VFNPDQQDTDDDGFGNLCDADLNKDMIVNFADSDADLNSDGYVNFGDLALMKEEFFGPPGPSGLAP